MKEKGKRQEKEEMKQANREMGAGNKEENGVEMRDKEGKQSLTPRAGAVTNPAPRQPPAPGSVNTDDATAFCAPR